ncbi:flagellar motor switch protein FliM [Algiphilus sp. NNCM1]|uniref:flagellar motor switch protein FliM n=1 Tax=Algiphilus sp. TaxID=1872431 RepID=UPI001CA6542C|nr:flagellar motor switch protein FliM [Algiphilus sp.]MBY8966980.1 flagellar motor switch protein FliM [Algiphilus acroporae]MCI5064027.1 flagellar motor switch protein FliM [Algiphilus sp.]MCI5103100.1 flagellar motor switch protein FliM [Algiphilus sp.]
MSGNDLLSQDEIDALLGGVDSGAVDTEEEDVLSGEPRPYDLAAQDRIIRGRLPTLEMINERFARYFRIGLFNMLRRSPEISIRGVEMLKFSDYVHSLFVPTSLNLAKVKPLRGTALFVFEPKIVVTAVDTFFGGAGKYPVKIEGREFTPVESRVIQLMLHQAFHDMSEAWGPVMRLEFEHSGSEVNPHFATIVSPSELVVVSKFHVELEGGSGDIHVTLPYAMVEPIKDLLDAGLQSDRDDRDDRWAAALKRRMQDAYVELSTVLGTPEISLRRLMQLKPGDVIPLEWPEQVDLSVEDLPVFRGHLGHSNGNYAVQINEFVKREQPASKPGRPVSAPAGS